MAKALRAEDVVREVDAFWSTPCHRCAQTLAGQEVVLSLLMGFRTAPHCSSCLAEATGRPLAPFLEDARSRIRGLDCYRAGWEHADRRQAQAGQQPALGILGGTPFEDDDGENTSVLSSKQAGAPTADTSIDFGESSCGDLALQLRKKFLSLAPGTIVEVIARDIAAPQDIQAWCHLTKHVLLHMEHPHYWIQRKQKTS